MSCDGEHKASHRYPAYSPNALGAGYGARAQTPKTIDSFRTQDHANLVGCRALARPNGTAATGDELAYTTVQTMLNVLQRKGHVARSLVGRAYEYRPLRSRDVALGSAVRDLLNRMFDGSVEGLVMNMLRTKQIDSAKLAELAELVSSAERESDGDRK